MPNHKDAPPAPPPFQPITAEHNPYEFITNPQAPPKKSLIPGGNSKTGRMIVVGAAGIVLLLVAIIFISLLNRGSGAVKADYASLASQQTEIIRVSNIGVSKARQAEAKNLAITTQLTLSSQQSATLELAEKAGADTDPKTLALSKNEETDKTLDSADQSNQFDQVFIRTLHEALLKYQQTLKKLYDASSDTTTKETLSKEYKAVGDLLSSIEPAAQ